MITNLLRASAWRPIVVACVAILAATVLVGTGSAAAAPRPKSGPCVVSAGVTYTNRNLTVVGTAGHDTIDCSGQRKAMTIIGNGGGDQITGTPAADSIYGSSPGTTEICDQANGAGSTITGGAGADVIYGSVCGAFVRGGPGNDRMTAIGGPNTFDGEDGDDTLDLRGTTAFTWQSDSGAQGFGGAGNDTILFGDLGGHGIGDAGNDHLVGGAAPDWLEGSDGDDSLEGNGGADRIEGGPGVDQLLGGDGDDTLFDSSADNDFFVGGNNDTTTPPLPRPAPGTNGAWGDTCDDADGMGTAPGDPDGSGQVGEVSAVQNDSISGCEYLFVDPSL